jgi:putative transposase
MLRIARFIAPGYPQHIAQRGNNRATVFCDDEGRYI